MEKVKYMEIKKREKFLTGFQHIDPGYMGIWRPQRNRLNQTLQPHLTVPFSIQECCQTRQHSISSWNTCNPYLLMPGDRKSRTSCHQAKKKKKNLSFSFKIHLFLSLSPYLVSIKFVFLSLQNPSAFCTSLLYFYFTLCKSVIQVSAPYTCIWAPYE